MEDLLNLLPQLINLKVDSCTENCDLIDLEPSLKYSLIDYVKYEYPNKADSVKKLLELSKVKQIIDRVNSKEQDDKKSLDLGCATCRYPLLFAKEGFFAVGYDINDTAIAISRLRAKNNNRILIEKNNILTSPPEENTYNVITCMMGTFDHIKDQLSFINWIFKSLKPSGTLIISFWNPKCPYTNYLNFYTREERELIQNNTRDASKNKLLLEKSGFLVYQLDYFCYLPDSCFEAWMDLKDEKIIEIDYYLSQNLNCSNSQMYLIVATKPLGN